MADVEAGEALYSRYSTISEEWLSLRRIVLARKMPRRMLVQPLTILKGISNVCNKATPHHTTPQHGHGVRPWLDGGF